MSGYISECQRRKLQATLYNALFLGDDYSAIVQSLPLIADFIIIANSRANQ